MRDSSRPWILAFLAVSVLLNLECGSSRPSLQLKVLSRSTSGDSMPLPQATLCLLDVDPIYLVMSGADERTPPGSEVYGANPRLKVLAGKLNARRFGGYSLSSDVFLFIDQSRRLWEPHVLRSLQTDLAGNARFDNVSVGRYWLMGYSQLPREEVFWVRQVDIKDGTNELVLDRSNALYVK